MNKAGKINKLSEESKELITDMGNTEYFELCETSSKQQCPDCKIYMWKLALCVVHVGDV